MKTLARILVAIGVCLCGPAWADGTINTLTAGSALTGTELVPMFQGSNPAVSTTPNAIKTFINSLFSGDCTVTSGGAVTCLKTNGTLFGTAATANTGTSGATLGLLNGNLTFSGSLTFSGLGAGTQVSCLGLTSGNVVVPQTGACGSGSGSGTVNSGTAGQLGYYSGTGTTISGLTVGNTLKITGTTIDTAATVLAGTTQTVTAAQWAAGDTFAVTTAAQTLTLPASSTLATNGGIVIQTIGQSVTVAPNAADAINGGTAGVSKTIGANTTVVVTTDGAGNIHVPDNNVTVGNPIDGSCTSGFNLYNNGGVIGCQANGGGGGTVTTTGTPVNGNLTKFSGASSITNGDLSGDVTTSGTLATTIANNAVTTAKINNSAVTLAKIANAASNSVLLGSGATGSGSPYAEITLGTNLSMSGTTLNASGGGGGLSCPTGFTATVGECVWAQTASASSSLAWTGLTGNAYRLDCDNIIGGNSTVVPGVQLGTGVGPTYGTGASDYTRTEFFVFGGTQSVDNAVSGNGVRIGYQPPTSSTVGQASTVLFTNLQSANNKFMKYQQDGPSGATEYLGNGVGRYVGTGSTSAITAIRVIDIQATPSTFSGVCRLVALY